VSVCNGWGAGHSCRLTTAADEPSGVGPSPSEYHASVRGFVRAVSARILIAGSSTATQRTKRYTSGHVTPDRGGTKKKKKKKQIQWSLQYSSNDRGGNRNLHENYENLVTALAVIDGPLSF